MMKKIILPICLLLFANNLIAQNNATQTLDQQFEEVIKKSNSYQEFKVVKKTKLNLLRKNINDSIVAFKNTISSSQTKIKEQKNNIDSINEQLSITQNDLSISKEKENGIEFLGILTKKTTYNLIMWSIVGILLALLFFVFYKFKNSNIITKKVKLKLEETEEEFDSHKKKTLEREQKIRRKLQDEINKNRNV